MKLYLTLASTALLSLASTPDSYAHCEVPCGIYTDDTVLKDLHTHQQTIEKAMKQIAELSKNPSKNANQLTRWVMNKESHATKLQNTMMQYFLAQRIKLGEADSNKESYLTKLTLAHKIIVLSMKCKQSADLKNAGDLHTAIDAFTKAYLAKK